MKANPALIFALHGTSRGFGFVLFEGPFKAHDWGTIVAKGDKNRVCLRKLEQMLDHHRPTDFLLEAAEGGSLRSPRIAALYAEAATLAAGRGIEVHIYSFRDVQAVFRTVGAATRQEIAEAVARSVASLADWVPRARRPWDGEHRRMSVYCAAALVLTHFRTGTERLFEDLRPGGDGATTEA